MMYYYVKGTLVKKGENYVVVEAGGVGYLISTSLTSISRAGETGHEIVMYTYLHVREDVMELYGFTSLEEKEMFMHLLSVSGVGPKAALAVLSVADSGKIAVAVVTNDVNTIKKAAGVGQKMAQRIILELKDKLKTEEIIVEAAEEIPDTPSDTKSDAVSALVALGYSAQEAQRAVSRIDGSLPAQEIIKKALGSLIGGNAVV